MSNCRLVAKLTPLVAVTTIGLGCAGPTDPYTHLTWIEVTTPGAFAPVSDQHALLYAPINLGSGDDMGVVTYESYLAWIAPNETGAVIVEVPTSD